jgi:AcrR family transcriptional regulator
VSREDTGGALPPRRAMSTRRAARTRGAVRRPSAGRADQIVRAAADLFLERGYVGTSIADIAERVGILPGSLYHYIDSKDDLLFTIVDRAHRELIDSVERQPVMSMPPEEAVRTVVRVHLEQMAQHLTFGIISNRDLRELDGERRASIVEARTRYQRMLSDLVRRGQEQHVWCAQLDPILASLTISAIGGSMTTWYRPDEARWSIDEITRQFASMVVRSLSCDHVPSCPLVATLGESAEVTS